MQVTNSPASSVDSESSGEPEFTLDLSNEDAPEDARSIEEFRATAGFSRRLDGRLQLHSPTGELVEVKLDGKVEGESDQNDNPFLLAPCFCFCLCIQSMCQNCFSIEFVSSLLSAI